MSKSFLWFWCIRSRIPFLNFPIPCWFSGGGWILGYGDTMGYNFFRQSYLNKLYEGNNQQLMNKYLQKGMAFIDIGANQGCYTILASRRVGKEGKVIAFEPVPSVLRKLQRNISINRLKNIVVESLAVGSTEVVSNLYLCLDGRESLSSLRQPADDVVGRKCIIQINVISLDKYIADNNLNKIDFVKIDTEGGELDVLRGGCNIWRHYRPVVMCEMQDKRTKRWNYNASEIYKFLSNYDYCWFESCYGGDLCHAIYKEKYDNYVNLLAVPSEKIKDIEALIKIVKK